MSESETRNLVELKRDLEERISRVERELNLLRLSLRLVDEALTKAVYKPAGRPVQRPEVEALRIAAEPKVVEPEIAVAPKVAVAPRVLEEVEVPPAAEQSLPIKSKRGRILAPCTSGRTPSG